MKKTLLPCIAFLLFSCYGHSQFTLEKAHQLLNAYVKAQRFNGSVLVAQHGQILLAEGYGYRDAANKTMNDAGTIYQIGSVTKEFTSTVILQLAREKKLTVMDKLSKYYPGFPHGDSITLQQLMSHTSGIWNYTNDRDFMQNQATKPHTEAEMLALFRDKPLDFPPGTKWSYSNSNYMLLGYIVARVAGKPYEQAVRERIFGPLGMTSSGFDFTHLNNPEKAIGYSGNNGAWTPAGIVDSSTSYGAGAIYSSVEDIYKWDRALYTTKILDAASKKEAWTPVMNHYGYGWGIDSLFGKQTIGHDGGIFGFTSSFLRFPEDETVIILMDNTGSSSLHEITNKLAALVYGKPYELPEILTEITVDPAVLQTYVGEYQLQPNFIIAVTLENGQLITQATNQGKIPIHAQTKTMFFVREFPAKLEFVPDTDGKVNQIILHQGGRDMPAKRVK